MIKLFLRPIKAIDISHEQVVAQIMTEDFHSSKLDSEEIIFIKSFIQLKQKTELQRGKKSDKRKNGYASESWNDHGLIYHMSTEMELPHNSLTQVKYSRWSTSTSIRTWYTYQQQLKCQLCWIPLGHVWFLTGSRIASTSDRVSSSLPNVASSSAAATFCSTWFQIATTWLTCILFRFWAWEKKLCSATINSWHQSWY